jgi:uncharacterized membrane protein YbjE (DUF340 family)
MALEQPSVARPGLGRRIVWLVLCLAAGALVGATGHALSGDARWYLAMAAAFAAGWLFFANPMACEASARRPEARSGGQDAR